MNELDPQQRAIVGESWRWRMEQEHLAVSVFARMTVELAELGCQPAILELCARAVSDEVRHAQQCRDAAIQWLGADRVPPFMRGAPPVRTTTLDPERAMVLGVVEACCVSETLTCAFFTELLERARTEPAIALARSLLADEIDHGRIGWALLEDRRRRGMDLGFVAAALPELLERQAGDVIVHTAPPDDPALEAHGYLGPHASAAVYRTALVAVVLPGFEAIDIDTTPARQRAADLGWGLDAGTADGPS